MKTNQVFTILEKSGGIRAARIITENKKNLSKIRAQLIARQLRRGVPVAKIINKKWFYGMPFYTNRWTLDPRPDSETMVDTVIKEQKAKKQIRILDLGTGTGCLICALVANLPGSSGVGIDKSWLAARVARKNVWNLGLVDRIKILRRGFNSKLLTGRFDIIISNPPYIARGDGRVNDGAKFDPKVALYAGDNGLAAYKIITKNAARWLKPGGKIYLEIGQGQGDAVREIFNHAGWKFDIGFDDLGGIERVLSFTL